VIEHAHHRPGVVAVPSLLLLGRRAILWRRVPGMMVRDLERRHRVAVAVSVVWFKRSIARPGMVAVTA
jgi:hypothetical protein